MLHGWAMTNHKDDAISIRAEYDARVASCLALLKRLDLTQEQLLVLAANIMASEGMTSEDNQALLDVTRSHQLALKIFAGDIGNISHAALEMLAEANNVAAKSLLAGVRIQKSSAARKSAFRKVALDPRKPEKAFVQECWKEWQKAPHKYKSKAAFAKDMLDKCQHLESQKKIEDWCRKWEKLEPS